MSSGDNSSGSCSKNESSSLPLPMDDRKQKFLEEVAELVAAADALGGPKESSETLKIEDLVLASAVKYQDVPRVKEMKWHFEFLLNIVEQDLNDLVKYFISIHLACSSLLKGINKH